MLYDPDKVLWLDTETHSSSFRWRMPRNEFVRLGQYAWGDGEVHFTHEVDHLADLIRQADLAVAHNGIAFDFSIIFGTDSTEPLRLALEDKLFDPMVYANIVYPAPGIFYTRDNQKVVVRKPEQTMRWLSLDNLAFQLDVPGKVSNLEDLAKQYVDKGEDWELGFGRIPLDNPEFLLYAEEDIHALRRVTRALFKHGEIDDYIRREMLNAAIDDQNAKNGWRVNKSWADSRVAELNAVQREHLTILHNKYDFPLTGKKPLTSNKGKEAIAQALNEVGISLDDLPRTDKGNPSFGGKGLLKVSEGRSEEARSLCQSIATIAGIRPLAQQALDYMQPDGKVHPQVTALQRSGRKSTTKPGLTTWTSRGPGAIEKQVFIANADDELLVEFDYSQADARIVAAYSGDREFTKRFAPGADAHMLTAEIVWGHDVVHASEEAEAHYRQLAKAQNHAYAYRAGARTLARTANVDLSVAKRFVDQMQKTYRDVTRWQERVTRFAERNGYVMNSWGRRMVVERGREFTQAPAQLGQSGTRELVVDALINIAKRDTSILQMLVAQVHDAIVLSIPRHRLDEVIEIVRECMEVTWEPSDGSGQAVHFPVGVSKTPSFDWYAAGH